MTNPYQLAVGPSSGTTPTQVLTIYNGWRLDKNLDDGCSFTFTMPGNTIPAQAIGELNTDIWLYRGATLYQRFRIIEVEKSWGPDGQYDLGVRAVCYRRLLASRHVVSALSFTGVKQGDIIADLITHTQSQTNGYLGITIGSTGPYIPRDRAYPAGQNILDAIVTLTQADGGPSWAIDENLILTVSVPGAYPYHPQPLLLGVNALALTKPSGADRFANVAIVSGDTNLTTLVVVPSGTLGSDTRGRWERYQSIPSESIQANLTEAAEGILEVSNSPAIIYTATLETERYLTDSDYELGDFVTLVEPPVVIPNSANPAETLATLPGQRLTVQILTVTVEANADGNLDVSLTAIQSPQRWEDVPSSVTWNSVPVAITWDTMSYTYL